MVLVAAMGATLLVLLLEVMVQVAIMLPLVKIWVDTMRLDICLAPILLDLTWVVQILLDVIWVPPMLVLITWVAHQIWVVLRMSVAATWVVHQL